MGNSWFIPLSISSHISMWSAQKIFHASNDHRTKGDCMSRNYINDRSLMWWERGSCFMFKLLSPTRGSNQPWGWDAPVQFYDRTFQEANLIFLQSITNLWQRRPYVLRDHYLLSKCSGTKAWSSKDSPYLCFKKASHWKTKSHHCQCASAARRILQDLGNKGH